MLIAKLKDGQVIDVSDYQSMFPDTSFPSSGPNQQFMDENNCMYVNVYLPYDSTTQCLISSPPYIMGDWVYTVRVDDLTPEQIAEIHASDAATNQKRASDLLYATDWTVIPDVINPDNNPYLLNQDEFISYRNIIRSIAVNPTWDAVFPDQPKSIWSDLS